MSNCAISSTTEEAVRPGLVREEGRGMCGFFVFFFPQVLGILRLETTQEMAVVLRGEDVLWMEDGEEIFQKGWK